MIPATSTSDSAEPVSPRRQANTTTSSTTTTSSSTTTSTTTTTTVAPVTPAGGSTSPGAVLAPVVVAPGLGLGDRGPDVANLERALDALGYEVGPLDDVFDDNTRHAVVAFQKVTELARTGRATVDVTSALSTARPPSPLVPGGPPIRIEIDLVHQVLFLYDGGELSRILPVSTGSGKRFCDGGRCRRAVTPAGKFHVYKRISGWRKSELGRLFNPLYFNQGIAIHGYPSVPVQPASHGCVRIPMAAARWFPERVPDGTPVYVLDGKTAVGA